MARRWLVVGSLAVVALVACDKAGTAAGVKEMDGAAPPGPPKQTSLDLAKASLATAKAKHAKKESVDADCAPIKSLEADFAKDTSPDAVKTRREIDLFCDVDVKLEGAATTLKNDHQKLTDAIAKKDRAGEQMYAATVKDGCASIKEQLAALATAGLDGEAKVTTLKTDIDRVCAPAAKKK